MGEAEVKMWKDIGIPNWRAFSVDEAVAIANATGLVTRSKPSPGPFNLMAFNYVAAMRDPLTTAGRREAWKNEQKALTKILERVEALTSDIRLPVLLRFGIEECQRYARMFDVKTEGRRERPDAAATEVLQQALAVAFMEIFRVSVSTTVEGPFHEFAKKFLELLGKKLPPADKARLPGDETLRKKWARTKRMIFQQSRTAK